ncbi:MAG: hypothetical protein R3B93_10560 [Bacteroidia bacterium]
MIPSNLMQAGKETLLNQSLKAIYYLAWEAMMRGGPLVSLIATFLHFYHQEKLAL